MPWSKGDKGQEGFRDLALRPVPRGTSVCVALCDDGAGVSEITKALTRHKPGHSEPRVVSVFSGYAWNAVWELAQRAGTTGRSLSDCLRRALLALTEDGARPVTILFQESHLMSIRDMELLLLSAEDVIHNDGLAVRAIMLQRTVQRWVSPGKNEMGYWRAGWAVLPKFLKARETFKRLHYFAFNAGAMEQLRGREIPKDLFESDQTQAVRTARALSA